NMSLRAQHARGAKRKDVNYAVLHTGQAVPDMDGDDDEKLGKKQAKKKAAGCKSFTPSLTHRFLRRLQDQHQLLRVYSQNVDGLEAAAGADLVLVMGTSLQVSPVADIPVYLNAVPQILINMESVTPKGKLGFRGFDIECLGPCDVIVEYFMAALDGNASVLSPPMHTLARVPPPKLTSRAPPSLAPYLIIDTVDDLVSGVAIGSKGGLVALTMGSKTAIYRVTSGATPTASFVVAFQTDFAATDSYQNAVKFSPDGGTIATGGEDGVVRLWTLTIPPSKSEVDVDNKYRKSFKVSAPVLLNGHNGCINGLSDATRDPLDFIDDLSLMSASADYSVFVISGLPPSWYMYLLVFVGLFLYLSYFANLGDY
ncbi:hypothetical protein DYB34_007424, partial [Aphanomyces astaci]